VKHRAATGQLGERDERHWFVAAGRLELISALKGTILHHQHCLCSEIHSSNFQFIYRVVSVCEHMSITRYYTWIAIESSLIKNLIDISLPLTKPHGKQFRTLHSNEVCLTLISNCLGQQSLATARRAIKQNNWKETCQTFQISQDAPQTKMVHANTNLYLKYLFASKKYI
jgi:hypothetical protein